MKKENEQGDVSMKPKELAVMLSISTRTVCRLLSAGKLPKPVLIGGSKRFLKSDIELFLECKGNMELYSKRRKEKTSA